MSTVIKTGTTLAILNSIRIAVDVLISRLSGKNAPKKEEKKSGTKEKKKKKFFPRTKEGNAAYNREKNRMKGLAKNPSWSQSTRKQAWKSWNARHLRGVR